MSGSQAPALSRTSPQLGSRQAGTEPRRPHSGRELFFKSSTQMMAVSITLGPTFVVGTPRPLFSLSGCREARNRQQYDGLPDDRRFVMIRECSARTPDNVAYFENWLAELEAKLRAKH